MQLAFQSQTTMNTTTELQTVQEQLQSANQQCQEREQTTFELTRDMTRQYKGMQDELIQKINGSERRIQELTDELHHERLEREKDAKEMKRVVAEKDNYIAQLNHKMEELCLQFSRMIQDAVEKMQKSIEIQGASYNSDIVPIQQRIEEFNFFQESSG